MAYLDQCDQSQIEYRGNGSQVLYTFPFTYMKSTDVYVDLYNETTRRWETAASTAVGVANHADGAIRARVTAIKISAVAVRVAATVGARMLSFSFLMHDRTGHRTTIRIRVAKRCLAAHNSTGLFRV